MSNKSGINKNAVFTFFTLICFQFSNIAQVKTLTFNELKPKNSVYVIAHRGAHNGIPENSIPAYQKAIDLGCDFIEIDIRTTKDGKFVSMHNASIDSYVPDQTDHPEELIAFLKKEKGGKPDPQLSQNDNDYIDRQAKVFLDTIRSILAKNPPTVFPENRERTMAKLLADAVFHDQYAVYRKPVREFFHDRVDHVIHELETTKVEKGVRIWKIYNMAFIARTPSVTIAFDLVSGITSGSADFAMSPIQMNRIVKQCDALFITHRHADHVEKAVAEEFIRLNLPVVAPDQVWKNDPISEKIIHPERSSDKIHKLKLKSGIIELTVFPGHQMKSTDNNVYLVKTPEGISIAHIGDQINEGDFMEDYDWIDKVAQNHKVDVLIPNSWTNEIMRIAAGFNPRLILPGHEIEMGHPVWDRVPYWGDDEYLNLNYHELKKSKYPVAVMMWGESVLYIPK